MVTAVDPRMPLKFLPWQSRYRWDVPSRRGPSFSRPTCAISIFQMGMGQNCHLHHPHGRFMAGFFHIGLAGWPCTPSIPPNPEVIGDHRASIFTTFHHSFLSLSLTRTLMLATTRNYTFHTANIPLWAAPCVLWSSLRLFAVLQADRDGPCWTPKRLIFEQWFSDPWGGTFLSLCFQFCVAKVSRWF